MGSYPPGRGVSHAVKCTGPSSKCSSSAFPGWDPELVVRDKDTNALGPSPQGLTFHQKKKEDV